MKRRSLLWLGVAAMLSARLALAAWADETMPPGNVTATSGEDQRVTLSWAASTGATSYSIYRSQTQNDSGAREVAKNLTGTTHVDIKRVSNDATYYYRIKAISSSGPSAFSKEVSATTRITRRPFPDGDYTMSPGTAPALHLKSTDDGLLMLAARDVNPNQRWHLVNVELATYRVAPASAPQRVGTWTFIPSDGGYRIVPMGETGSALTADGRKAAVQALAAPGRAQSWNVLPISPDQPDPGTAFVPAGYHLVFADEFNGRTLDLAAWQPTVTFSQPHLNDELENYLPEAVTLENGMCVLTADEHESTCILAGTKPEPPCKGIHHYRSGSICSRAVRRAGYYEARFKVPGGKGLWPAFWLTSSTRWPPEWDILEIPFPNGTLFQYQHPTARSGRPEWVGGAEGPDSAFTTGEGMPNPYDSFVVYGCEVTPHSVKMWVNGVLTAHWKVEGDTVDPMWVCLNLAVGGSWPGAPDETTQLPARMTIDYVRVYQSQEVEADVKDVLAKAPAAEKKSE
jgi:beta-glucanase (GH16 family)